MRKIPVVVVILTSLIPAIAFSQDHDGDRYRSLRTAAANGETSEAGDRSTRLQQSPPPRSWVVRHPVLFGALVGSATVGAISYATYDDGLPPGFDSNPVPLLPNRRGVTIIGAAVGAGLGAAVGALVGLLRD